MNQPLQPDHARLLQSTLLGSLQREHQTTLAVIAAIPTTGAKSDYRPDPVSKTAIELAWHIAVAEKRFLQGVIAGEFDFSATPRPDSIQNSADVARWYEEMFEGILPRLQELSPEQLSHVIDFRGLLQQPAVLYLQIAINHMIHHRGQLSTYLRPMGGKVPSIYGESYDSAEARKAAQAKSA